VMIPFELVSANSILLQNRPYGIFIVATSFYNAPKFRILKSNLKFIIHTNLIEAYGFSR
jgi:hypothetical protein